MSTVTYLNNSIMGYVGADAAVVNYSGLTGMPDWEGSNLYLLQTVSGLGAGLRKFDIDADGDETLQVGKATIGVSGVNTVSGGAACLSYDGANIFFISETGNSCRLANVRTSDFQLLAQFGTASSNATASSAARVLSPHMMSTQASVGGKLMMACSNNFGEIDALPISAFTPNANLGNLSSGTPTAFGTLISKGYGSSGTAPIYALELPFNNGTLVGSNTGDVHLYSVTGTTITHVGSFKYSDVDATWGRIFAIRGIAMDETDGQPIIGVSTDEVGPTNTKYILKLNKTTCAVVWKLAVNNLVSYSWGFTFSRIRNQRFHYVGTSALVYHINTSTGALTSSETFTGLSPTGPQYSDDVTNSVITYGNFTPGVSPPDYVGSYMDTGGHHTLSSKWMRVWFATAGGGGGGNVSGGNMGGLALSELRAWTYTLDKHKFYVLDLGAEGTWQYDLSTGEWCRNYTTGYSGRWDLTNGIMWAQRIIGGDITSATIWELSPSAVQDNDSLDIPRLVTGGVQTRSRDSVSCDLVSVACSVGKLGNVSGGNLSLRFSDDGGNTFSDYFTVALTSGTYDTRADYEALGSFAAPGRVFEISDSSGPATIEGADVILDGKE